MMFAVNRSGQILLECLLAGVLVILVAPSVPGAAESLGGYTSDRKEADKAASEWNRELMKHHYQRCQNMFEAARLDNLRWDKTPATLKVKITTSCTVADEYARLVNK